MLVRSLGGKGPEPSLGYWLELGCPGPPGTPSAAVSPRLEPRGGHLLCSHPHQCSQLHQSHHSGPWSKRWNQLEAITSCLYQRLDPWRGVWGRLGKLLAGLLGPPTHTVSVTWTLGLTWGCDQNRAATRGQAVVSL